MNISNYVNYCIKTGIIGELGWAYSLMGGKTSAKLTNKYITTDSSNVVKVLVDEEWVILDTVYKDRIPLNTSDKVHLKSGTMLGLNKDVETTLGYVILNYVFIHLVFHGTLPYIESGFDIGKVNKLVSRYYNEDKITLEDFKKFRDCCVFMESYSRLVTTSATYKNMIPPDGIQEYKEKLNKEYVLKYGSNWREDASRTVQYGDELKVYADNWMRGDESDGILISGKVRNNAMVKKFQTFGTTTEFGVVTNTDESLYDGYPEDTEKLAAYFNTSRSASLLRGKETQVAGAIAKYMLRALSGKVVSEDDCGVKYGYSVMVREHLLDIMVGMNIIDKSGKVVRINTTVEGAAFLNKTVILRTPAYCKTKGGNYCSVCVGSILAGRPKSIPLLITGFGSILLLVSMKAMHDTQLVTVEVDMESILK